MRRCRGLFRLSGAFFRLQFSADYTITMFGFDFRQGQVVHAHPRTAHFKEDIIQAFYDGIKHKPETTFGNVKADVLADKDPHFTRGNFCSVIRGFRSGR